MLIILLIGVVGCVCFIPDSSKDIELKNKADSTLNYIDSLINDLDSVTIILNKNNYKWCDYK